MLQSFTSSQIEISDVEIRRSGISYSIDTIKQIKRETNAKIFWIVGSDILAEFHRWKKADNLLKMATFLIFPRDPHALPKIIPEGFEVIRSEKLLTTNFSSTIVRERIRMGKSIKNIVPESVEKCIRAHNLYVK
jgi:nicotinate-nucleotide adenylyltransferase